MAQLHHNLLPIKDILKHAEHILNLGGENALGFGCDFDGIGNLPRGIENVSHVKKIIELFQRELGEELTDKIAYGNFLSFFETRA